MLPDATTGSSGAALGGAAWLCLKRSPPLYTKHGQGRCPSPQSRDQTGTKTSVGSGWNSTKLGYPQCADAATKDQVGREELHRELARHNVLAVCIYTYD